MSKDYILYCIKTVLVFMLFSSSICLAIYVTDSAMPLFGYILFPSSSYIDKNTVKEQDNES